VIHVILPAYFDRPSRHDFAALLYCIYYTAMIDPITDVAYIKLMLFMLMYPISPPDARCITTREL